jgi:hypothetical protein
VKFISEAGEGAMISIVDHTGFVFGYKCNNECIYGNNYLSQEPMSEDTNSLGWFPEMYLTKSDMISVCLSTLLHVHRLVIYKWDHLYKLEVMFNYFKHFVLNMNPVKILCARLFLSCISLYARHMQMSRYFAK